MDESSFDADIPVIVGFTSLKPVAINVMFRGDGAEFSRRMLGLIHATTVHSLGAHKRF
jgi:hypothetical protein